PRNTAGVWASLAPLRQTVVAAGLTYVGSWNAFDYVARFSCFAGTGPCRPTARDYIIAYPGFVKLNASVSQTFSRLLSGFIAIDNVTNNYAYERYNFSPVMGRITTIGMRFQY